ncbi:YbhB/YbcL family Raf kinase inhibitor-like protein [Candidatus Fermentibacteria bacterium]|nr:MAG: YbhB/YbcL family Raf kinase inhibitor-like protein [Candidatus Fermentibacteria bacterium]
MEFLVSSSAFSQGANLPCWYCASGLNSSPPLGWAGEPDGTVSLAVVCISSEEQVHWVLWNIPPDTKTIYGKQPAQRLLSNGIRQGINDYSRIGWTGPYEKKPGLTITVHAYALDTLIEEQESDLTADQLVRLMEGHILAEAELTCECS